MIFVRQNTISKPCVLQELRPAELLNAGHPSSAQLHKVIFLCLFLLTPAGALARVNPLKVITERSLRSEIIIVMDTSGSMAWQPSPAYAVGADCGGERTGTVDLCGDGLCSGTEGSAANPCPTDCPVASHYTSTPGSTPACNPSHVHSSRIYMVKRVLRNLLPQLRKSASFGLVTFSQSGYYTYYRAQEGEPRKVSLFFSATEMNQLGAWDNHTERPRTHFTHLGNTYTLLSSAGLSVTQDSLYGREDDMSVERRFRWQDAGMTHINGGLTWKYRGSYYSYAMRPVDINQKSSLDTYQGPQFTDGVGQTWIYHRFNYQYTSQGIIAGSSGMIREPLSPESSQAAQDQVLYRILGQMNLAANGGLWAWGGTPTGSAIETAKEHYLHRQIGSGSFSSAGPDPAAACRPRFVLLLTDGQSNQGSSPAAATASLYNNAAFSQNPIKTLVVGLPGLPASAINELDHTADMGDDGIANSSKTAFFANDETALMTVLTDAFLEILQGDYTTTPPGVTTSGSSYVNNDVALVASTRYPGWKGRLRAVDLTSEDHTELWEAGELLSLRDYKTRRLFTGYPDSNVGLPIPLLAQDGTVNLQGGCAACGTVGVKDVWQASGATLPSDEEIQAVVLWLAGKEQEWKLGPILRSTPASVGPPPPYNSASGHDLFRKQHASRERLIYITSNRGLLHAFRALNGDEVFAYVPPNLWPTIHSLWKRGGQDTDPADFRWVLASSPRVEDIPPQMIPQSWSTQLVLTMGPGAKAYVVLDITNPVHCSALQCSLEDPPLRILAHSRDLGINQQLGETWSVPAVYYDQDDTSPHQLAARMGMGSGYGDGVQGDYYHAFSSLMDPLSSVLHDGSGAVVDYAVLASTTAAVDREKGRQVIATYQGDLNGRMVRYQKGDPALGSEALIAKDSTRPFYYSPAALHTGGGTVLLAAATGSHEEQNPPANVESLLHILEESGGKITSSGSRLRCKVSDLCAGNSGCPEATPDNCKAPSSQATPVAAPLLLNNKVVSGTTQQEAFFLFYDPPTSVCSTGSSWLIRMATSDGQQQLLSSFEYQGVRATGLSLVGGRIDIAITRTGNKGEKAGVYSVLNNIDKAAGKGKSPFIETWREMSE